MKSSDELKKIIAYLFPILILTFFLLILTSGYFVKMTFLSGTTIPETLVELELIVESESWEEAESMTNSLQKQWDKLAPFLQISTTEEDIKGFSQSIIRLKGYIRGQELGLALSELKLLNYTWNQFET